MKFFHRESHTTIANNGSSSHSHVQEEDHDVAMHAVVGVTLFVLSMLVIAAIAFIFGH